MNHYDVFRPAQQEVALHMAYVMSLRHYARTLFRSIIPVSSETQLERTREVY